ncbi:family 16 glycosylhydrolase [Anaerobaca lacustris]|uniref:Family 16 glycosylhydrolase n=1 Tax=Anaerobaca lacustris TaxID=3044600 RepID=A0AAW6TRC2_9BACT|nr:family 16 glycosylhydrolase [Sedimentisphaerales bacterium M17dextr]
MLQPMWRTISVLVLGTVVLCNAEAKRPESWVRTGPLGPVPERVSDRLPLSDQSNEGDWVSYEPMTDEFDGTALDPNKWWPRNPGWLGRQPAYFWPGNVTVSDGKLHLAMRREEVPEMPKDKGYHTYTSAAVQSKGLIRYGYFEVKARPMRSHGSSSFWFYHSTPEEWTEIDVFEIGGGAPGFERKYNMNVHVFRTPTETEHWSSHGVWTAPTDLADNYHAYGLEWGPGKIKWYFDGVLVRWVENTHWHQALRLNFDSETMPEWFGLPEDGDLPSTYSIEYVRSWKQRADAPLPVGDGYKLVWSDEFDGETLDLSKWDYRGLGPRRNAINVKETVSLDGEGHLVLTTKRVGDAWHTAMIGTQGKFETTFGYFECRVRLQEQIGHWSAFWLQSPSLGDPLGDPATAGTEIDIFEYLRKDGDRVHHNLHWDGYGEHHKRAGTTVTVPGLGEGWHTFGLLWTEAEYVFYVDGHQTWRSDKGVSHRDQYIILSLEVGTWAGDIAQAELPDHLYVDYVRVYKKAP